MLEGKRVRVSLAVLRCLPYAVVAAGAALLPWLMGGVNQGQRVPWDALFSTWPPFVILVILSGLAAAAVVAARAAFMVRMLIVGSGRSAAEAA